MTPSISHGHWPSCESELPAEDRQAVRWKRARAGDQSDYRMSIQPTPDTFRSHRRLKIISVSHTEIPARHRVRRTCLHGYQIKFRRVFVFVSPSLGADMVAYSVLIISAFYPVGDCRFILPFHSAFLIDCLANPTVVFGSLSSIILALA